MEEEITRKECLNKINDYTQRLEILTKELKIIDTQVNIESVRNRVDDIRRNINDPESAHSKEDKLHLDVLRAIADGIENYREIAKEVIKTEDIEFPRWCA